MHRNSGHNIARRLYPTLGDCQDCGKPATDRHHIDGDTFNNERENIAMLCRRCHQAVDGRLDALRAMAVSQRKLLPCLVCQVEKLGGERVYGRCRTCYMYFRRNGFDRVVSA
jgi:5-methylcytosine-specific restriction endonuclease McrA